MTLWLFLAGLAALGALAGAVSYRSGRRARLLLAFGSPFAILFVLFVISQVTHPCADAEGECYEGLGLAILGIALFLAVEAGTLLGALAGWLFRDAGEAKS